ncbi:MAG: enoyl-CoA hydratase/isomerase family protein [Gammaproteobacteria bacterium]|nr:enoyl-CoA hydratase/isomerase family protein [Gammaproteobacteria bacterium]
MSPAPLELRREGEVAIVEIEHPPVNALAWPLRAALLESIVAIEGDTGIRAVVIHGRGRHFIAGADVREFDAPPREPLLAEVLARLEALDRPVIAALHGTTQGGGAELALACHYRCATRDLSMGFPEIKLGLLPGAGGTVRLPRLVGLARSLEMMTDGAPIGCDAARDLGLIDRVIEGDPRAGAIEYARELIAAGRGPRRTTDRPVPAADPPDLFERAAQGAKPAMRRIPAYRGIVGALDSAARLPWREAQAVARASFESCRESTASRALRHLFFAERSAPVQDAARTVARIGVLGAGTMGSGIAIAAASAGYEVSLVDARAEAVRAGRARVETHFAEAQRKGRITAEAASQALARLHTTEDFTAFADADLIIEAVFEDLAVKREVFARLDGVCRAEAILATNTSTLDVEAIAAATSRAPNVVGMHFFSPAHVMRLLEVVRTGKSSPQAVATALSVGRRLGKICVLVGNGFGFVGNRMLYAYGREKELMMLEGAQPQNIDRALEEFGMAMGPNAVGDLAGLDIGYAVRKAWRERPDDLRFYRVSDLLVEHGRLGQKNGRGFYRYEAGARRGTPDPEVTALVRAEAGRLGIAQREVDAQEIVERCMLALINEGARILEEGIAARAADVDLVWCHGYGFPRDRGGPLFHADTLGLDRVLARIRHYAGACGPRYWEPAPSIVRLAAIGGKFAGDGAAEAGR